MHDHTPALCIIYLTNGCLWNPPREPALPSPVPVLPADATARYTHVQDRCLKRILNSSRIPDIISIFLCFSISNGLEFGQVFFFPPPNFFLWDSLWKAIALTQLCLYTFPLLTDLPLLFFFPFFALILQESIQMSTPPESLPQIPVTGVFLLSHVPIGHLGPSNHRALWVAVFSQPPCPPSPSPEFPLLGLVHLFLNPMCLSYWTAHSGILFWLNKYSIVVLDDWLLLGSVP